MRVISALLVVGAAVAPVTLGDNVTVGYGGSPHVYCQGGKHGDNKLKVCPTKTIPNLGQCKSVCMDVDKACLKKWPGDDKHAIDKRIKCTRHQMGQWAKHNKDKIKPAKKLRALEESNSNYGGSPHVYCE